MSDTCYMCEERATSREHVPPKCIFPEAATYGKDVRRNLISVPSCDLHNQHKSELDLALRAVLTMAIGANRAGRHQFFEKNLSRLKKSRRLFEGLIEGKGSLNDGTAQAVRICRSKFDASIDHMVRGLYFHTYERRWLREIRIFSPMFYDGIENGKMVENEDVSNIMPTVRTILGSAPVKGENPGVFKYRVVDSGDGDAFAMAAMFYEAFEVFAVSVSTEGGSGI